MITVDFDRTAAGPGRRIVVVGGTGFLGRQICARLTAAGDHPLPVSRRAPVPVDLTGPGGAWQLAALLARERADVVVNAAGAVWLATAPQQWRGNAELVERLVAAVAAQPQPPRLIQLGTVHEYGPGTAGHPTTEDQPAAPVTDYGRSKLQGTETVLRAARVAGLDAVVLRVANVCGPGTPPGSLLRTVADHLAAVARDRPRGRPLAALRLGPLRGYRDFVDVRDAADAVLAATRIPAARAGWLINVGRGQGVPVRWLVDRLVALSGLPVPVVEAGAGAGPGGAPPWQQLDIATARRVLGWWPRRELEESLRDLLAAAVPPSRSETEVCDDERPPGTAARRGAQVPPGEPARGAVRAG